VQKHGTTVSVLMKMREDYDKGYLSRKEACCVTFAGIDSVSSAWDRARERKKQAADELEETLRGLGAIK
jgi:hypothetical protein